MVHLISNLDKNSDEYKSFFKSNKFDKCITHAPCIDGMTSFWIANKMCPGIEMIHCKAGCTPTSLNDEDIEREFGGHAVLCVDISLSPEYTIKLSKYAKCIGVIDHHITYYESYLNESRQVHHTFDCPVLMRFDMKRAACQHVWKVFMGSVPEPWFLKYIADWDLYEFREPNSREISLALYDQKYTTTQDGLDELYEMKPDGETFQTFMNDLVEYGQKERVQRKIACEYCMASVKKCTYKYNEKMYKVFLFSCPKPLLNEMSEILLDKSFGYSEKPDFVVAHWQDLDYYSKTKLSFRSKKDSDIDVSKLVKKLNKGGGGHPNAAACVITSGLQQHFWPVGKY